MPPEIARVLEHLEKFNEAVQRVIDLCKAAGIPYGDLALSQARSIHQIRTIRAEYLA